MAAQILGQDTKKENDMSEDTQLQTELEISRKTTYKMIIDLAESFKDGSIKRQHFLDILWQTIQVHEAFITTANERGVQRIKNSAE